jgi:hypothetical protein
MFINHEKVREGQKADKVVAVVATSHPASDKVKVSESIDVRCGILLAGLLGFCIPLMAAVLPEERADMMYHSYSGGGITINGPSILARKSLGEQLSIWGNYYIDSITSASIDVITTASPYTEERTENGVGFDYLHDSTTLSMSYANSVENDFVANSMHFTVSQDMFGDLTTVSMGYSRGWDEITATANPGLEENAKRQHFRLGVSQILTKNLLMDLSFETISDEGFLNNPYRQVRYLDSPTSYARQLEEYPNTRTSHAVAIRALYYLPYRAAIKGEYRIFNDTWGIQSNMTEVGYTHPFENNWTLDFSYRAYSQTRAEFYSDLFPFINAQNYLARDKELSTFTSQSYGLSASYEFAKKGWKLIDKGSANISYSHILFDYKDFRDIRVPVITPGTEPLYSFSADVFQLYVSVWY